MLFVGVVTVTQGLGKPEASITDAFASVSLSEPLLSHSQKQHLNPLVIDVLSATKMPSTVVPFAELKTRYIITSRILFVFTFFC